MRIIPSITAAVFALGSATHADIYQWEYINPADPGQGKRQGTALAPGGAGVDAVPGAYLYGRDLTMAYLIGADLTGANGAYANLTNGDLTQANLTNASFGGVNLTGANFRQTNLANAKFITSSCSPDDCYEIYATLTDADFTDADVRGAMFNGMTLAQLYSTASYKVHDLTGIGLRGSETVGGNFAGQNLTNASFYGAWLTDADFTGANIRGASFAKRFSENFLGGSTLGTGITPPQLYSTASFQAHDLSGINLEWNNLDGADFAGQDLTNTDFYAARLTGADFSNAKVQGAKFTPVFYRYVSIQTGITPAQLYATASYHAHDLSGIGLGNSNLSGANFAGQNLTNADFYNATLTGADFTGANVRGANFGYEGVGGCHNNFCWPIGSGITPAQLYSTASYQEGDLRGVVFGIYFDFLNVITTNLILANGHVAGLDLDAGRSLVVRDFNSYPMSITIDEHLAMGPGGTLRVVFEADAWDSTISFAPGIPVTLGGTLELAFAADVNLASQVGRTFDVFNWTGVTPTGAFAISSPYAWDLSNLYTTGEVTLLSIPEPGRLALTIVGAFGLILYRRRKMP